MIKYDKEKVFFVLNDILYELTSQPYEPCLYINKEGKIIKIIHNAFTTDTISDAFQKGRSVEAIDGKEYTEDKFCKILEKFMEDTKTEVDFTYIANKYEEK